MKYISNKITGFLLISMITLSCSKVTTSSLETEAISETPSITVEEVNTFAAESATKILSESDKNKSGTVTQEEANLDKNEMKALDTNSDGKIDQNEIAKKNKRRV